MMGVGMAGFGIPINEFSFGNTLIIAGTTAVVGGLIVDRHRGCGRPIAADRGNAGDARRRCAPAGRSKCSNRRPARARHRRRPIPFPPRPKSEAGVHEPQLPLEAPAPADMAVEDRAAAPVAPMLRNPDMPAVAVAEYEVEEYDDVSLSPQQPMRRAAPADLPSLRCRRCGGRGGRETARAGIRCSAGVPPCRLAAAGASARKQAISMPCGRPNPGRPSAAMADEPHARTVGSRPWPPRQTAAARKRTARSRS